MDCDLEKVIINSKGMASAPCLIYKGFNLVDCLDYAKEEVEKLEGHEGLYIRINCDNGDDFGFIRPKVITNKEELTEAINYLWDNLKSERITRTAFISTYSGDDTTIRVDVYEPNTKMDHAYINKVLESAIDYLTDDDGVCIPLAGTAIQIDEWIGGNFIMRSYVIYPEDLKKNKDVLDNLDDYCMTTGTKYRE